MIRRIFLVSMMLVLAACAAKDRGGSAPENSPGTRLTADEVRRIFIGAPWKSASGVFTFNTDGSYRYKSTKTTTEWGPWPYVLREDGSIEGATATYTFYRIGQAYRYYHSESDAFYLAFPNTAN